MNKIIVILAFIPISFSIIGQTMKIAVFYNVDINTFTASIREGKYYLECDGESMGNIKRTIFSLSVKKGGKLKSGIRATSSEHLARSQSNRKRRKVL